MTPNDPSSVVQLYSQVFGSTLQIRLRYVHIIYAAFASRTSAKSFACNSLGEEFKVCSPTSESWSNPLGTSRRYCLSLHKVGKRDGSSLALNFDCILQVLNFYYREHRQNISRSKSCLYLTVYSSRDSGQVNATWTKKVSPPKVDIWKRAVAVTSSPDYAQLHLFLFPSRLRMADKPTVGAETKPRSSR